MTNRLKEYTRLFLVQRHQLLAFLFGLVRDRDAAEEMLQEVWIRLADAAEKGVEVQAVDRWCRGVARNLVLHYYRQKRSARVVADTRIIELAEQAFAEQDDADPVWTARRGWLLDCLEGLPAQSRELLDLKYTLGLRVADIAGRVQRSQDAVMKALSRIRQALAECVERRRELAEGRP
jgi:RNA polymerase sigma-70 factor (ECF subfamily)